MWLKNVWTTVVVLLLLILGVVAFPIMAFFAIVSVSAGAFIGITYLVYALIHDSRLQDEIDNKEENL